LPAFLIFVELGLWSMPCYPRAVACPECNCPQQTNATSKETDALLTQKIYLSCFIRKRGHHEQQSGVRVTSQQKQETDLCHPAALAAAGCIHTVSGKDMEQQNPDEWRAVSSAAGKSAVRIPRSGAHRLVCQWHTGAGHSLASLAHCRGSHYYALLVCRDCALVALEWHQAGVCRRRARHPHPEPGKYRASHYAAYHGHHAGPLLWASM